MNIELQFGEEFAARFGKTSDEVRATVSKIMRRLSYREREIIKLRYGLGDGYKYTLEEVAHIFKVTRERIRQVEKKALAKIATYFEAAEAQA